MRTEEDEPRVLATLKKEELLGDLMKDTFQDPRTVSLMAAENLSIIKIKTRLKIRKKRRQNNRMMPRANKGRRAQ